MTPRGSSTKPGSSTKLATTLAAMLAAGLAVWLIGLAASAYAATVGKSDPGQLPQITGFEVQPENEQAGSHSTINLWMRFCGDHWPVVNPSPPPAFSQDRQTRRIANATNATSTSPIQITTEQPSGERADRPLRTGDLVTVQRAKGNTAANNDIIRITVPGGAITGATNASPIVITSANHGLVSGDKITVTNVGGNTAANNGTPTTEDNPWWTVTVIDANTFSLNGSTGNADYTAGGTWIHRTKFTLDGTTGASSGTYVPGSGVVAYARWFGCAPDQTLTNNILKDFVLSLPPGLLGNPTAVIPCPRALWIAASCPEESIVGNSTALGIFLGGLNDTPSRTSPVKVFTPLMIVETLGPEPARLGTTPLPADPPGPLPILVNLRTSGPYGDFGVDSAVDGLPSSLGFPAKLFSIDNNLCAAVPCDRNTLKPLPGATVRPFAVNPTSCKPATSRLLARPYPPTSPSLPLGPAARAESTFTPTGCPAVPFSPTVNVTPVSKAAGAPTSTEVEIQYPDYVDDPVWQSALKDIEVVLPDGMSLAAGGGVGLESCSREQFGIGNDNAVACPEGSRIGKVAVDSPALSRRLFGRAFLSIPQNSDGSFVPGAPTEARPWTLFIVLEGQGVRVKIEGTVALIDNPATADPNDRLIKNVFRNNPETPFTRFALTTKGPDAVDADNVGSAALANPPDCNTHTGEVKLYGYKNLRADGSDTGDFITVNPTVTPTEGCAQPFAPRVTRATALPEDAAANSTSFLTIERDDGNKNISRLNLSLPPGAVGSLATVPRCPAAQARVGNCSDETKVGIIRNTVGYGASSLTVPGSLYIGEPLEPGDAASFIIVVPAKVGPIDLGSVVVVNRVQLRQSDTGVDVLSGEIPTILQGIPLPIKKIDISTNRENFFINPSGCDSRNFVATFFAPDGTQATSSLAAAAKNCANVPFGPKLRIIAGSKGFTQVGKNPALKAIVTQKDGESNIKTARVVIPDILRPNVPRFQNLANLCNDIQLAARACPPTSVLGNAKVRSPVLPFELSGPVYAVLERGAPLPKLAVFLRGGGFEIVLIATNGFQGIQILNTFANVPDAAQSYFELNINSGKTGALIVHDDLCTTNPLPEIDATFTAQSGKVVKSRPRLEASGCEATVSSLSIRSQRVRITRKGVAKIRMRCGSSRCKGRLRLARRYGSKRYSIGARKSAKVAVKLSRKARRAVLRSRRGKKVRASVTVTGGRRAAATITLLPPKKRR